MRMIGVAREVREGNDDQIWITARDPPSHLKTSLHSHEQILSSPVGNECLRREP